MLPESRLLLRLRNEKVEESSGPWFGAERTLNTAVAGLFRRQQSLKGANIGADHVAEASNSVRPHEKRKL